jgi:sortase A
VTDKNRIYLGAKEVKVSASRRQRFMQTISTVLIFSGLILVGLGIWTPLRDYLMVQRYAPPPLPPEAVVVADEPLPGSDAPSLADNPLPVVDDGFPPNNPPPEVEGNSLADNPLPVVDDGSLAGNPLPVIQVPPTPTPTPTPEPTPTPTPRPVRIVPIQPMDEVLLLLTPTPVLPTLTPTPTPSPTPEPFPPAQSIPSRIVAPAINLDSPVVEVGWSQHEINGQLVSAWNVANYAAGWHKNSALPGHVGNVVLSGHHNILGEVFRYIVDLEPGDLITLYADERPYVYKVEDKFIVKDKGEPEEVRRANARWIGPFTDQRLTMITCWPYNNNTHRVVVIAKPFLETEVVQGSSN